MQEEQETSKSKETMEKIIQAGRYVLNQKDYYEAVVEEIAAVAGIAKATVFFYFKTKENLFKQILYSLIKDIYILIEKILNEKLSPIEKLKKIYDSYIEFQLQNMNLFNSLRKILSTENPKIEEVKEKLLNISQQMIPLIEEMLNKGLIKKIDPTIPLAEVVPSMLMMYASAVSTMVFFYPNNINKIKDIFWEVLLHGILHEEVSVRMTMFNEKI